MSLRSKISFSFKPEISIHSISKIRLIVGFLIGIAYAIVSYAFLFLFRELLRIYTVQDSFNMLILPKEQAQFYNLWIAFFAVIIGHIITIRFWIEKPRQPFEYRHFKFTNIKNNISVLALFMLVFIARMAIIYAQFIVPDLVLGYKGIDLYFLFKTILILMLLVLFFQSWITIVREFKRTLKWQILAIIIISVFSISLAQWKVIDYEKLDQSFYQNTISYRYDLKIPMSNFYQNKEKKSLFEMIHVVQDKVTGEDKIIYQNEEVYVEDLDRIISEWKYERGEYSRYRMICQLVIHSKVKMKTIFQIQEKLQGHDILKVAYTVLPTNDEHYSDIYYTEFIQHYRLSPSIMTLDYIKQDLEETKKEQLVTIELSNKNEVYINTLKSDFDKATLFLDEQYLNEDISTVLLVTSDTATFENYITIRTIMVNAIYKKRDEVAMVKFGKNYNELDNLAHDEVRDLIPYRLLDLTEIEYQKLKNLE